MTKKVKGAELLEATRKQQKVASAKLPEHPGLKEQRKRMAEAINGRGCCGA